MSYANISTQHTHTSLGRAGGSGSALNPIDLTEDSPPTSSKKRKAPGDYPLHSPSKKYHAAQNGSSSYRNPISTPSKKSTGALTSSPPPTQEKRRRRFRAQPPQSFYPVRERALSQRFYVLRRIRSGTDESPSELVDLTGSTGNVYTVRVGQLPTCNCPHGQKRNLCKHVVFVMTRVLNAPYHFTYQLALLGSELQLIFQRAPPADPDPAAKDEKRKPIEGECPICYSELGDGKSEGPIVWCRAACGQNIHKDCLETWARTKRSSGNVTCPMCRGVWEGDADVLRDLDLQNVTLSEGYINVAAQMGISPVRDTSTYSEWMGRRRRGRW